MIGTKRATRARPHVHRERPDASLPDAVALAAFEAEFFVEWQVADDLAVAPGAGDSRTKFS